MNTASGQHMKFRCARCDEKYAAANDLNDHFEQVHESKCIISHACIVCLRDEQKILSFSSFRKLYDHVKKHDKRAVCEVFSASTSKRIKRELANGEENAETSSKNADVATKIKEELIEASIDGSLEVNMALSTRSSSVITIDVEELTCARALEFEVTTGKACEPDSSGVLSSNKGQSVRATVKRKRGRPRKELNELDIAARCMKIFKFAAHSKRNNKETAETEDDDSLSSPSDSEPGRSVETGVEQQGMKNVTPPSCEVDSDANLEASCSSTSTAHEHERRSSKRARKPVQPIAASVWECDDSSESSSESDDSDEYLPSDEEQLVQEDEESDEKCDMEVEQSDNLEESASPEEENMNEPSSDNELDHSSSNLLDVSIMQQSNANEKLSAGINLESFTEKKNDKVRCGCVNCRRKPKSSKIGEKRLQLAKSVTDQHKCHLCEQMFQKRRELRKHITSHRPEKPFACDWKHCDRKFKRSDELKRHILMHTGEKNFSCPLCKKKFGRSDHLMKHALHVHKKRLKLDKQERSKKYTVGIKPNRRIKIVCTKNICTYCDKRLRNEPQLRKHERIAHNIVTTIPKNTLAYMAVKLKDIKDAKSAAKQRESSDSNCGSGEKTPTELSTGNDEQQSNNEITPTRRDKTRAVCGLCSKKVLVDIRQLHVMRHIREPRMFECPLCDFSDYQCTSNIKNHIKEAHGADSKEKAVTNFLKHRDKIDKFNELCFPGYKNKKLPWLLKKESVYQRRLNRKDKCELCNREMLAESRQIHVIIHHLKVPRLYECPKCEFAQSSSLPKTKDHIQSAHTEWPNLKPVSHLMEYSDKLAEMNKLCFPNWEKKRGFLFTSQRKTTKMLR